MAIDLPDAQIRCVAAAVYHEARGESELGQRAVAHVVYTRAKKRNLTPCQVIKQPGQFCFRMRASYSGRDWNNAIRIAKIPGSDPTNGASYFHSNKVSPKWRVKYAITIGNHRFYK